MLSRVAENLYWMARYLERTENVARLITVNTNLLLDLPRRVLPGWAPLIEITGSRAMFAEHYAEPDERGVVKFLVGDATNPGSILSSLGMARENARTVRDFIPREAWEQVNELYLYAKNNQAGGLSRRRRYEYLRGIILGVQQIAGLLAGTMTHDEGYDLLRMGRNLERADMTLRIIDVRSENLLPGKSEELTPFENIQWVGVLKSLSAYQMYRRAMQVRVRRPDVLRFLFKERLFPRAVYYTISEVENCLRHFPHRETPLGRVSQLRDLLTASQPEKLDQAGLRQFIDSLELGLNELNQAISDTYFLPGVSPAEPVDGMAGRMKILLKRVYETAEKRDGCRVLVDRLWPRGLSRNTAQIDLWLKDLAPSAPLRQWFAHDPRKWSGFRKRYFAELTKHPEAVKRLRSLARRETVTLVFGAQDEKYNNAVALKQYLGR